MRSTAVPGYSGSIIGVDGDSCVELFLDVLLEFWISPVAETTNADALLVLLLPTAAAAKLENRMLADVVANEKTIGDKNRIWRYQKKVCRDPASCLGLFGSICQFCPYLEVNLSKTEREIDDGGMSDHRIDRFQIRDQNVSESVSTFKRSRAI